MASDAYTSASSWSWPRPVPQETLSDSDTTPGTFTPDELDDERPSSAPKETPVEHTSSKPKPQRVYPPRTCRICLEIVHPTYHIPTEGGIAGLFNPAPTVEFISEEAESGRLISPCKCRGSQRYVHEGCLQEWRHADRAYGRRNYWECPTCHFKYRLERMRWSKWIRSTSTQVGLTVAILFVTVFLLGFVADPIINLYLDPVTTLTTNPLNAPALETEFLEDDEELSGWAFHIVKGLTSLGLLGFVKVFLAMSPWQAYYWRNAVLGGGNRNGRGGTGRDRMENISWTLVIIGVSTFLWAVWKGVRAWSRRTLEKASERVVDVQGDDDEDTFEETPVPNPDTPQ